MWRIGLACGGTIDDLFVEPVRGETFDAVRSAIRAGRAAAVATVVSGTDVTLGRRLLWSQTTAR